MAGTNLENFEVIADENGEIAVIDGKICLRNKLTGDMVSAMYTEVAEFSGLPLNTSEYNIQHGTTEIYKWSDYETHALLNLYSENDSKVGHMKKFRTKKEMWCYIAENMAINNNVMVTPYQVEGRLKTVIKKTKDIIKNNQTSGAVRKQIPFESSMDVIISNDDSIVPEVFIAPNKLIRRESLLNELHSTSGSISHPHLSHINSSPEGAIQPAQSEGDLSADEAILPARKKQKCLEERMVDRLIEERKVHAAMKGENRERRHKERMEKRTNVENLLEQILQKLKD